MGGHVEVIVLSPAPAEEEEEGQEEAQEGALKGRQDQELWRQIKRVPIGSKVLTRCLTLPSLGERRGGGDSRERGGGDCGDRGSGEGERGASEGAGERAKRHEGPKTETQRGLTSPGAAMTDAKEGSEGRREREGGRGRVVRVGGEASRGEGRPGQQPRSLSSGRGGVTDAPAQGTSLASQGRRASPIDVPGNKRHKTNGASDAKQLSIERRQHRGDVKGYSSDARRPTTSLSKSPNGARVGVSTSDSLSRKGGMRRDSQSKGSKLAPPEGGSRAGSPDLSGGKSPSSGRSTPTNCKSPTPIDEKAKAIINKTSDTDKVMAQFVSQDGEEGGKARGGSDASAAPAAPVAHTRPSKPPVEDRALQAVLAARRRSLENAGKAEPKRNEPEEETKQKQSEEAKGGEAAPSEPPPWMAGVVVGGRAAAAAGGSALPPPPPSPY